MQVFSYSAYLSAPGHDSRTPVALSGCPSLFMRDDFSPLYHFSVLLSSG